MLDLLKERGYSDGQARKYQVTAVLVPGLTETKCRALNLALNKISGDWDYEKLPTYLAGLDEADFPLTGFSLDEVGDLHELTSVPLIPTPEGGSIDVDAYLEGTKLEFRFVVPTQADAETAERVASCRNKHLS
jgi:hypothetical protein